MAVDTNDTKTTEERVWERVKERLSDLQEEDPDAPFEDLGADSLDIAEILISLEREFDLEIPMEVGERMTSVKTTIEVLKELGI